VGRVIDWRCAHEDGGEGEKNEELHGSLVMKSLHDTAAGKKMNRKKKSKVSDAIDQVAPNHDS